jgi:hypothetical protein
METEYLILMGGDGGQVKREGGSENGLRGLD